MASDTDLLLLDCMLCDRQVISAVFRRHGKVPPIVVYPARASLGHKLVPNKSNNAMLMCTNSQPDAALLDLPCACLLPAVAAGYWRVRLLLADMQSASKLGCSRTLTILAEGQTVLKDFSLANSTAPLTAATILFIVPVTDGKLSLEIQGGNGDAFLNGLVVEAVNCSLPLPRSPAASPSPSPCIVSPPPPSPSQGNTITYETCHMCCCACRECGATDQC
jgi:hypothetical protein